ncbi:MAG: ABC transporter substrate-binding protein [Acidimicrobiia bacterium]|nr:ABC transporter substrate-binding protein [Acidimicrobiia bacterium]
MFTIRRRSLLALVLAFVLVAAACGGDDDESAEGDDAQTETDETAAEAEDSTETTDAGEVGTDEGAAAAVEGDPVAGGTLVIGSTQVPRHLNGTVQSGYATAVPGTQLNASPLLYDDDFNPQPYLAESWEVADDGLSVTLNLVEGAVFHDGEPITSEDVAFSIITARDNHPFKPMFAPVTDVETPDDQTAIIRLSQPHPAILLAMSPGLSPVIPEHIFNDGQDITTHPRNTEDFVGSGPFTLAEYDPESIIRLQRFDDFFIPDRPYLDEIVIEITPDPTTIVLGLENGTTDLSSTLGPAANILRLQDNADLIVTSDGHEAIGQVQWLEFNLADPVLGIKEVRQAIAYAVDREFMAETLDQGTTNPAPTGIAPQSPFFSSAAETYPQDIERAKQLLADAGFAEGEIELTIDYIPPTQVIYAEYVVQALEEIGIQTELSVSPDFPTWAERVSGGDFQMTINNVWNWGDPVIGVHRTYLSSNRVGVIWTNNTGYENADVDSILDKAGQTFDLDERVSLYADFQDIVAEEVPILFLTNPPFWQAYSPRVQNPPLTIWGQMSPMHEVWLAPE